MKNMLFIISFLFCVHTYGIKPAMDDVSALEHEMVSLFQKTLKDNYGRSDAIDLLMTDLVNYRGHYLLKVDREKIEKINTQLYAGYFNYFYDKMQVLDRLHSKNGSINPYSPGMAICLNTDSTGYLYSELENTSQAFLKKIFKIHQQVGATSVTIIDRYILENYLNCVGAFKTDKEVQSFFSVYFWWHLCYCANVSIYTGKTK